MCPLDNFSVFCTILFSNLCISEWRKIISRLYKLHIPLFSSASTSTWLVRLGNQLVLYQLCHQGRYAVARALGIGAKHSPKDTKLSVLSQFCALLSHGIASLELPEPERVSEELIWKETRHAQGRRHYGAIMSVALINCTQVFRIVLPFSEKSFQHLLPFDPILSIVIPSKLDLKQMAFFLFPSAENLVLHHWVAANLKTCLLSFEKRSAWYATYLVKLPTMRRISLE